jgi:hypothetical protein
MTLTRSICTPESLVLSGLLTLPSIGLGLNDCAGYQALQGCG